jgi:hypothetical protein
MLRGKKTQEQRIDQQGQEERRGRLALDGLGQADVFEEGNGIEQGSETQEIAQSAIAECNDTVHDCVLLRFAFRILEVPDAERDHVIGCVPMATETGTGFDMMSNTGENFARSSSS